MALRQDVHTAVLVECDARDALWECHKKCPDVQLNKKPEVLAKSGRERLRRLGGHLCWNLAVVRPSLVGPINLLVDGSFCGSGQAPTARIPCEHLVDTSPRICV